LVTNMNDQNMARLRELLLNEFSEEELASLCQDAGINYAELPGVGAYGKTREMIEAARARHTIRALMVRARDLRPEAYKAAGIATLEAEAGAVAPRQARAESPVPRPRPIGGAAPAATTHAQTTPADTSTSGSGSVLSPRVRMAAIAIAVLLLAVVVLSLVQPKPATTPALPAATGTIVAAAPTSAPAQAATAAPTVQANVAVTPGGAITATIAPAPTQRPTVAATATPVKSPTPQPTPTISESHAAAQAVRAINEQLVKFYTGEASAEDLKQYWRGDAYQVVLNFAYNILKRQLGVDLARKQSFSVGTRYTRVPFLVSESGNTAQVQSREYWRYTNPTTKRTVCETRNYSYTLMKEGDTYRVYQVNAFRGDLVGTNCQD
jgi:hypothetical protein